MRRLILCFVLILCLGSISTYKVYADSLGAAIFLGGAGSALASGEAVGAIVSVTAILPYALAALGIAGLGYIAYDSGLIDSAVDYLKTVGDYVVDVGSDGVAYLKTVIENGKSYLSDEVLKALSTWGLSIGLFDGISNTSDMLVELPDTSTISQSYKNWIDGFNSRFLNINKSYAVKYYGGSVNRGYKIRTTDIIQNDSVYGCVIRCGSQVSVLLCSNDEFSCEGGLVKFSLDNEPESYTRLYPASFTISGKSYYYINNTNSPGSNLEYDMSIPVINNNTYGSEADVVKTVWAILNGVIGGGSEGIPVTDNIPKESEGDVNLPVWDYENIVVDDSIYYPVSLPSGVDIPVIYPVGEDILLDGVLGGVDGEDYVWDDGLIVDPEHPDTSIQDDAQAGSMDVDIAIPSIPDSWLSDFLVDASIVDRFPFCIPGDVVRAVRIMGGDGSRAAPVYVWEYDLAGRRGEVVIDLSIYNDIAVIFRGAQLLLFVVGLCFASREVVKF